jgi:hypothetical protein
MCGYQGRGFLATTLVNARIAGRAGVLRFDVIRTRPMRRTWCWSRSTGTPMPRRRTLTPHYAAWRAVAEIMAEPGHRPGFPQCFRRTAGAGRRRAMTATGFEFATGASW